MGDGAEVFDEFVTGHAETVIRDGEGALFFVGGEGDFQRQVGLEDVVLRELGMAELFEGVGSVRDELAHKDFAVRVKRVDDDVEDLFDFGLEFVFCRHDFDLERSWLGEAQKESGSPNLVMAFALSNEGVIVRVPYAGLEATGAFEVEVTVCKCDGEALGGSVQGVDAMSTQCAQEEVTFLEVGAESTVAKGGVEVLDG